PRSSAQSPQSPCHRHSSTWSQRGGALRLPRLRWTIRTTNVCCLWTAASVIDVYGLRPRATASIAHGGGNCRLLSPGVLRIARREVRASDRSGCPLCRDLACQVALPAVTTGVADPGYR